ncbi:hypothetical protein NDU88_001045 [Pleurodeles waltl]|uniref:Uncharacterized protein n=1 Tax=Pleurodeles waltl TaxID=8319 RepID=A0AAV7WH77_PLEWA|nr:hypothetical protein NDU88_001045 [Pleurodeles waltl]
MSQHNKRKRRPRSRRRQPSHKIDPPTPKEAQEERQRVMAAVALLGRPPEASSSTVPSNLQRDDEHSDSDSETATSAQPSIVLPVVTPNTADELI